MQNKDNHLNPNRIYIKSEHRWIDVSEDYYRDHTRFRDAFRKRHQEHGQCVCPRRKFWLCDTDCANCEFRRAGDMLSLNYEVENSDGETCTLGDIIPDNAPLIADVLADKDELDQLIKRLQELMPEAIKIGNLRLEGLSDEAIADIIGIKRTTFRSRLDKVKETLSKEFPDWF
ncbi:bacterio-opsin activator [Pseudoramibacter faecis]|uniref:bacterio-opsin activator n=1 Tax=Pseudoramibacter faecis TaxID=3108534 RepID=UPI002E7831AF|nr:bacterio-opsin activator [Pseudoramibacter sp. HA2172]